ncbi:MAG: hypothetical protein IPO36_08200 [Anaerolineales bacterium]|nr:hypothetical protein [Anaerolineales bacterium]
MKIEIPPDLAFHSEVVCKPTQTLTIPVISMHAERGLIRAVMDAGAGGYILKDDQAIL